MKKILFLIGLIIFAVLSVMFVARILTDEDSWVCQNGKWVKHGNPNSPMPSEQCE